MRKLIPLILLPLLLFAALPHTAQAQTATTPLPVFGVITATPRADGMVVHVVQPGQTLSGIADAYGISLQDLLLLNNRSLNDALFAGDRLIVQPAFTPTPTLAETYTPTPRPATPTSRATRTPTPQPPTATATVQPMPTLTPTPLPLIYTDAFDRGLQIAILVLAALGALLVIAGIVLKKA